MLGSNGRPFRTREGGTVKLMELLDQAERRARAVMLEKNPQLADRADEIARVVGIGAGKYADLAVVALPDREAADPHKLLFDSDFPVIATWFRGTKVAESQAAPYPGHK